MGDHRGRTGGVRSQPLRQGASTTAMMKHVVFRRIPRLTSRARKIAAVLAIGLAAVVVGVPIAAVWNHQSVIRDYNHSVDSAALRAVRVSYASTTVAGHTGTDLVLFGSLPSCAESVCPPEGTVFAHCTEKSDTCIPAWTPVLAMPTGLMIPHLGGYPPKYQTMITAMLASTATKCTSIMKHQLAKDEWAEWQTLCVSQDGLVLYRRLDL